MKVEVVKDRQAARRLIEERHYRGANHPSYMHMFGLLSDGGDLLGVAAYGNGSNRLPLCLPEELRSEIPVLELNRLVLRDNIRNQASMLVAGSLRLLPRPSVIVSYADTTEGHIGTVYQATNWLYTGTTISTRDKVIGHRHSRTKAHELKGLTHEEIAAQTHYIWRPRKHRYVMLLGDRREVRDLRRALQWRVIESYPKEDMQGWVWIQRGSLKTDRRAEMEMAAEVRA